ncbi:ABC transporter permease [Opitutus sp. GAS368]|uniref:ABC transporter permease n=1 Tax=Opitutus sp. GAS368 TaxID=1882749 RepID=UPI00087D6291|nr:ABC transporter permease [Opitutus sp. GAS368]SDS65965.1 duplicated orphan permease [Opitutus sp. GAS368]
MLTDLKYALRSLLKTPGFAVIAIATLALCIGANSAIFSVVHAILLKPYPWPESERLVYVYNTYPLMGLPNAGVAIPDYLDRRAGVSGFADSAMFTNMSYNLSADGEPERIIGQRVTPSLFTTLQAAAARGRVFTETDAQPGADHVIVLSHNLWKNRFGANPSLIGQTIRLNTEPYTVIGVMPESFYFPAPRVQAWVPFTFLPKEKTDSERGYEYSSMIARLKPGATAESVQRDLDLIQARNAERLTDSREFYKTSGFGGRTIGFLEQNVGNIRGMLWLVQAGVAAALLIGCANVASLLLARAVARERELAIRAALGAGRARLMRLLLTESLVLFLAGGGLGLLVAWWGVDAFGRLGLSTLPRAFGVQLDFSVFAFTLLCALLTGIAFGALPAWSASRGDAAAALKEAGTRGSAGKRTTFLRAALVVGEIALAVMLLSTAGLLVRSFAKLLQETPGFSPGGVITARLDLPEAKYDQPDKRTAFANATLERLRALPGVQTAGLTTVLPFTGNNSSGSYSSPDIVVPAGAPGPHAQQRIVDPGYFKALGLTLLRGRLFSAADAGTAQQVVIVDQLLADKYWPGQDPIGKRINRGGDDAHPGVWVIVGVVASIKFQSLEEDVKKETLYFPFAQRPAANLVLVVKTAGDPTLLTAAVREAVRSADPEQPVFDIKTMQQRMDEVAQSRKAPMVLLSLFSGVALLLAVLGVYGVLAFSVAQRTSEFGVRIALGASPGDIAALVLRQGARLVLVGIAAGLAGYLALSSIVGGLLYGVAATDPATLAIAPVVLALAATAACLLPVRKAIRVNPLEALRAE